MISSTPAAVSSTKETNDTSLKDELWFTVMKYMLFGTAFIISVAGNSLVTYIIFTRIRMKTVTNLFILNLAIGDLVYTFSSPFDIAIQEKGKKWIYLPFFCKILSPLQTISMSSSLLTLMALSLTRYKAIVHPLERQMQENTAKLSIVLIWAFSATTVLPQILHQQVIDGKCEERWDSQNTRKAYTALLFGFQYVIPLTVMTTAYGRIGYELHRPTPASNSLIQEERGKEANKVVSMLITVTATFAICTLPTSVMWLWLDFGDADSSYSHFWDVLDILYIFDFINLAAHPILFVYFSKNFRSEMRATFLRPGIPTETNANIHRINNKYTLSGTTSTQV